MVMVGDCKHFLRTFQNHCGCMLQFRTWGPWTYLSYVSGMSGLLLIPSQKHFSVPPLCDHWMSFFSETSLCRHHNFHQDKSAHPLCFGMFGSDLCVAHQFCSKSFSIITSTCSSTSVQNAIVRHVSRAIAIFHDTSVQIRQRRPSGWIELRKRMVWGKNCNS